MVIEPLLVQLAIVVVAVTEIVLPAQGSGGGGGGVVPLFEQETKLADAKTMMIAKQINEIFLDIQLVLICSEIRQAMTAFVKLLQGIKKNKACITLVCYAGFVSKVALCRYYFLREGVNLMPIMISAEYNFTSPSPTPDNGIDIPGDANMEKFLVSFFSIPADTLITENRFLLPV